MNKKIYSLIRDRILSMEYKPGDILNEKSLAQEFGVSRTPLREVLTRLEWEKLLRVLPRTGSMVTEIEFQKMANVFQIRLELEDLAGRLAVKNITPEHLDKIKDIQKECELLFDDMDQKELANIDRKLRSVIYDSAHNPMLAEISEFLYSLTQRLWSSIFESGHWTGEVQAMLDEIKKTHQVLSEGDADKAGRVRRELLQEHVQRIRGKF